jgi:energy-coupling factor transporter ATP-binding protein EcfA2
MNVPKLIGITGRAGSGKDTLARHIAELYGHEVYAFATPLKQLLNKRFGWTMEMWDDRQWKESPAVSGVFVHGRQLGLQDPLLSPRQLAQWLGTDVIRDTAGADIWINAMYRKWAKGLFEALVISDVRFDNEAEAIRDLGGVIFNIVRPTAASINSHISEKGVQSRFIDVTITNDGSIDEFLSDAVSKLKTLRGEV